MAKPYSNQSSIEGQISSVKLAELIDDDNGATTDSTDLATLIAKADAQIETYARGKNTLPFADLPNTPIQIQTWSVNLTIFYLYKRRLDLEIPEAVRLDYESTLADLKLLQDGELLIDDPTSIANQGTIYKKMQTNRPSMFTSNSSGTGTLDDYYNGPC